MLRAVCRWLQYLREKREGGRSGDGERNQLAGTKAPVEGKRKQDESGQTEWQCVSGIHLLEIEGRMETEATGSQERQVAQEDPRDSVQKASGSATNELHIHKAEPSAERVDKLFPNRKHEEMAEGRVGPMAAPQSASSDSQTVEEAEDNLQESDEASSLSEEQYSPGTRKGSCQCPTGMVQESETADRELFDIPGNPCYA